MVIKNVASSKLYLHNSKNVYEFKNDRTVVKNCSQLQQSFTRIRKHLLNSKNIYRNFFRKKIRMKNKNKMETKKSEKEIKTKKKWKSK